MVQALVVLVLVWGAVAGVRSIAGAKRITAEKLERTIERGGFEDWSGRAEAPDAAVAGRRDAQVREVAEMVNLLDFAEREKARENRIGEGFFRKLSNPEKELFIDLTIEKSMKTFMQAIDGLKPEERKRFVEKGLSEIEEGRTEEEMKRARELSEDLLARISSEGMKAYFEDASADTKLDLAPLMEAMDGVMKGMSGGNDFGGGPR